MNFIQLFAFIILPLSIAAAGWGFALYFTRNDGQSHNH